MNRVKVMELRTAWYPLYQGQKVISIYPDSQQMPAMSLKDRVVSMNLKRLDLEVRTAREMQQGYAIDTHYAITPDLEQVARDLHRLEREHMQRTIEHHSTQAHMYKTRLEDKDAHIAKFNAAPWWQRAWIAITREL